MNFARFLLPVLLAGFVMPIHAAVTNSGKVPDVYIVVLKSGQKVPAVANAMATRHGGTVRHVYQHAIQGFSIKVPAARIAAMRADSRVKFIVQSRYFSIKKKCPSPPCGGGGNDGGSEPPPPEQTPTGVLRIGAESSGTWLAGNVNVNVAVIDSGISSHPDLTIVDGVNCSSGKPGKYSDGNGHGTHVAGTIGAKRNDLGVIGVAPGARLFAVRVLNNAGSGSTDTIICGINWIIAYNNSQTVDANKIKVANMSLGGRGSASTCATTTDPMHLSICNAVNNHNITFVVAAGNEADDASNHVPAAYPEVITVSALADFDGAAGGSGSATCRSDVDDTFANFSNYGASVDIIAPGVCIHSTWKDGGYNTISGTSMASPHVAGAAALFIANNPNATPTQVKNALTNAGTFDWNNSDDKDTTKEPLLYIGTF